MKYEFVPWTSYADRFLNELNSHGKLCDLIIGDSQWIGGAAENGTTSSSTTSSTKNNIRWTTSCRRPCSAIRNGPRTRRTIGRCRRWPTRSAGPIARTGSPAGDSGRVQEEVRPRSGAAEDLWELKQIAEFFQGREIDGKKVYGAYIFTERGSEGITMGVTNVLYDYGFEVRQPEEALPHGGLRQLARSGQGPGVLQGALQVLHGAGHDQRLHAGRPRRLQVRPGGDADELVRLLPRPLQGPQRRRRQDRLLRQSGRPEVRSLHPARRPGHLGRRLLGAPGRRAALHQVVRAARSAEEVVGARRLLGAQGRRDDPGFPKSAPFAPDFLESMGSSRTSGPSRPTRAAARHAEARA
jgi:hypothetical protein